MCAPRWHSPAVFASLVGGAGVYAISPCDDGFVWGGYYESGSLVWNSRWVTSNGIVECREALAMPGDPTRAVVLRRVRAVEGPAQVAVLLDPRGDFGRVRMENLECADGIWVARTGGLRLRWIGGSEANVDEGRLALRLELREGEHHDFVLEIASGQLGPDPVDPDAAWQATERAWKRAVPPLEGLVGARDARQAYAVMRGLTSSTGAMVAAATLGLPERAEQGRNYDYRYAWIRDQCYAGQAVARTGQFDLLDSAVHFVSERLEEDGMRLRPAYTVQGDPVPGEIRLEHLRGYPGGEPRVGNKAGTQFQLDGLGECLLLLAAAAEADRVDARAWRAAEVAAKAVEKRWTEPDAGIWEIDDRQWAESRLVCAAGLDAISRFAPAGKAARWRELSGTLMSWVRSSCVHPSGRWMRAPDDPKVDASLLFGVIRGAVDQDDPVSERTHDAVGTDLSQDGYVYRFRQDDKPLEEAEGAFLLCGFLMALSATRLGRHLEARSWFERNRTACGPPGLLTEEFDVRQRQLRGNFPQAFVHALLLQCAAELRGPYDVEEAPPTKADGSRSSAA
jgi:hypothetical protein